MTRLKLLFFLHRKVEFEERLDVHISLDTPLFNNANVAETDLLLRILRAADVLWNSGRRPVLCCVEGETLRVENGGARILARYHKG
jgi:hypothetical protein